MKQLLLISAIFLFSCSKGIEGEIDQRNIDLADFGMTEEGKFIPKKMGLSELKDKYSKDVLKLFDWYAMVGCKPNVLMSKAKQIVLKNTSMNKRLRFTINKTIRTYETKTDKENCFKPIMNNPKIEYDTDYENLNPGEIELLGVNNCYDKGKYVVIEYELAGAIEVK